MYATLDQDEYKEVWDAFEKTFEFKPDYYSSKPAIREPAGSMVLRFKHSYSDAEVDAVERFFETAFATLTPKGRSIYALDWQHESYRIDPHRDYRDLPISVVPDGDYFIFLADDMSFRTFGHPWQSTICIFGEKFAREIDA